MNCKIADYCGPSFELVSLFEWWAGIRSLIDSLLAPKIDRPAKSPWDLKGKQMVNWVRPLECERPIQNCSQSKMLKPEAKH